jgi:CBS domain-containing protein
MTPALIMLDAGDTIQTTAQTMSAHDVGAVLVQAGSRLVGLVTDRDLAVRGLAAGLGPDTPVRDVTSDQLVTVGVDDPVDAAVQVMRDAAVRRVPVLDGDVVAGIVSIGDLALSPGRH